MSERLKADMAVAKWEALGVSKFMWEWQHVIEKKHKAERDVGEMLRRRYHRPAFEMFGRHVENMARLKESSGMKDVGYRTLFKFLARVGLPRLYDKMKKEKIQLKTLRNCRQNKSLEDMLTRRLGIDAQSIRTISDALRTQKDIESERDDKLEKLRKRVNREQTRQVFESWLDAVMEQDSFRMKQ
uniref:Uncharacterized protein n=1 Tax=Hanusia phi TaxID=3032 RepID=A0A7S0HIK8_9CRYP